MIPLVVQWHRPVLWLHSLAWLLHWHAVKKNRKKWEKKAWQIDLKIVPTIAPTIVYEIDFKLVPQIDLKIVPLILNEMVPQISQK